MKEFVEKLIERLEKEILQSAEAKAEAIMGMCGASANAYSGEVNAYNKAIQIVNDLASEHNNGWISVEDRLPEDESKSYIVQKTNGFVDVLGFAKDAYKLSKYDFPEYKGKKKPIFYDWDSEYGCCEWECEAWQPLPAPYKKGE